MTDKIIDEVMGLVEEFARASEGFPDYYTWEDVVSAKNDIRAKIREVLERKAEEINTISASSEAPTGDTYELRTMQDVLNLAPEEFERMLPDLATWHKITRASAILIDVPVSELNAVMVWTDDGSPDVTGLEVDLGDYGRFDLLKLGAE